jgi:hypothetical protein
MLQAVKTLTKKKENRTRRVLLMAAFPAQLFHTGCLVVTLHRWYFFEASLH